jgi:hypothetical protein
VTGATQSARVRPGSPCDLAMQHLRVRGRMSSEALADAMELDERELISKLDYPVREGVLVRWLGLSGYSYELGPAAPGLEAGESAAIDADLEIPRFAAPAAPAPFPPKPSVPDSAPAPKAALRPPVAAPPPREDPSMPTATPSQLPVATFRQSTQQVLSIHSSSAAAALMSDGRLFVELDDVLMIFSAEVGAQLIQAVQNLPGGQS